MTHSYPPERSEEPLFLVPWIVPAFAAQFLVIHLALQFAPIGYVAWAYTDLALNPLPFSGTGEQILAAVPTLVTYGFIHHDWFHVAVNVALLLAAAGPVYRNCGTLGLIVMFALSTIGGALLHVLVYWGQSAPVIGASGGAAGVIAAAIRYRSRRLSQGEIVAPITRSPVSTFSAFWIGLNLLLYLWDTFGSGGVSGYATIAHIGGFLAGLFLAPLMVKGARPKAWVPKDRA